MRYDTAVLQQFFYSYYYNNPLVPLEHQPEALFIQDTYSCLRKHNKNILEAILKSNVDITKKNELNKYLHNSILSCRSDGSLRIREPVKGSFIEGVRENIDKINNQSDVTIAFAKYQYAMNQHRYSIWINEQK